ncbi:hypothetical protein ILYODFUR_024539 [Ilyodon furcidens]|uniref:Uncharacterized protein n=1 Tax=Ilyodon furcidens TaxID=33524 RepID=A0ABV0UIR3_9TELE
MKVEAEEPKCDHIRLGRLWWETKCIQLEHYSGVKQINHNYTSFMQISGDVDVSLSATGFMQPVADAAGSWFRWEMKAEMYTPCRVSGRGFSNKCRWTREQNITCLYVTDYCNAFFTLMWPQILKSKDNFLPLWKVDALTNFWSVLW